MDLTVVSGTFPTGFEQKNLVQKVQMQRNHYNRRPTGYSTPECITNNGFKDIRGGLTSQSTFYNITTTF